jgi:hypothetical protein
MVISIQRLMHMFLHLPSHTSLGHICLKKTYFKICDRYGKGQNILLHYLTVGTVTVDCLELIPLQKFVTACGCDAVQLS